MERFVSRRGLSRWNGSRGTRATFSRGRKSHPSCSLRGEESLRSRSVRGEVSRARGDSKGAERKFRAIHGGRSTRKEARRARIAFVKSSSLSVSQAQVANDTSRVSHGLTASSDTRDTYRRTVTRIVRRVVLAASCRCRCTNVPAIYSTAARG